MGRQSTGLGRQWRAASGCGEGVRELRGWQLMWGGRARGGEAVESWVGSGGPAVSVGREYKS